MVYDFSLVENVETSDWNKLLNNSKDALVTHTCEWVRTLCNSYPGHKSLFIIARNESGDIVGGMPIVTLQRKGFRHYWSMYNAGCGGFIIRDDMDEDLRIAGLRRFDELTKRYNGEALVVDFYGKCGFLKSLGFTESKRFTHFLELNMPFAEIWDKKIDKKARNETRQAIKKGVVIEEVKDFSEPILEMILKTCKKRKRQPYPTAMYENTLRVMGEAELVRWLVAKYNERPIATSAFLVFKESVTYWVNASHDEYLKLRPNNLLLSEMIKWSCENGYKYFNFGPSDVGAYGLMKFKEDVGGRKMEYKSYERVSPSLRLALSCMEVLKKVLKYTLTR